MNDLQQKLFHILQTVDACCRELGIKYFLDGGTLLGAVRHKGFIPWDDDIDIGMTPKNYWRFIREAPAWLEKHNLFLQEYSTEKTTPFSYIKVRLGGTKFVEFCNRNVKMHGGMYIDIFQFNRAAPSLAGREKQQRKIIFWEKLFAYHQTPDITQKPDTLKLWLKFITRRIIHYVVQLLPIGFIYKKLHEALSMNDSNPDSNMVGHLSDKRSVRSALLLERSIEEDIIELVFEGQKFPAPKTYDDYLTGIYGDYMTPPPEDERTGHLPYIFSLGE